MSRTVHNLPDNLNPTGDKCYPLFVPDDPQWNRYIIRAIRTLTFDRHWERDDNNGQDAIAVRRRWQDSTLQPFIDALESGAGCSGSGSNVAGCYDIGTTSDAVQYYPNNPFSSDEYDPILFGGKWSRWENTDLENSDIWQYLEDTLSSAAGYYANDVFVFPTDLPQSAFSGWGEFLGNLTSFWFPYLHFEFTGQGEIDIELLNFPLGGSCFIIPDADITSWSGLLDSIIDIVDNDASMPDLWITTDLDRGIPFDSAATQGQNVVFDDAGNHSLTLVFVPRIEPTNLPFIFPFGGFRHIEVCGDISFTGASTGLSISKDNAGTREVQQKGVIMSSTYQDFLDALDAHERRKAMRYLLASAEGNIRNDIEIDAEDLTTTTKILGGSIGSSISIDAPADDVVFGGGYGVGEGFQEIVGEIILRRTTQARTAQNVADILRLTYFLRGIVDTVDYLLDALGTPYTNATDTVTPTVNPVDIANLVYCYGASQQTLYRYAQQVEDAAGTDATDIAEWYRLLIAEITDEQIVQWYETGLSVPRVGYTSAPCYRQPTKVYTVNYDDPLWSEWTFEPFTGFPDDHTWRVSIQGITEFQNANGDTWDGLYHTVSGGNPVLRPVRIFETYLTPFSTLSTWDGQGAFGTVYTNEYYRANNQPAGLRVDIGSPAWTQGQFKITMTDLGII